MADSDVDEILQKFFVTIAEKDSDAFKLFEDNKRLRNLVEQTLSARKELESRHRTTLVLVDSLQAALREKECLIEAQDGENAAWREHIAELRSLLDRPSELNHGLEDLVEDVRSMSAELRSLRHAFQYARWCCDGWEEYSAEAVVQVEARERGVLEEAALTVLSTLGTRASEVHFVIGDAEARSATSSITLKQLEASYARAQSEREELVEAHGKALRAAELEAQQQQERAGMLQREVDAAREGAELQLHHKECQRQRLHFVQECWMQRAQMLGERCRAAETSWASTVRQLCSAVHLLAATQKEKDDLTAKHELVLLTQEHSRQRLFKLTKQVEQLKQQQSDLEDLQQRCSEQQEDLRTLRAKYIAVTDKERSLRQQLHTSTEVTSMKLQAAEEAASTSQRHRFSLEERLQTTQDALKLLQKEAAVLRRQCEEHRATQALLQATQDQLRETEKHSFNFQASLDKLREEQQAQLHAAEARNAAKLDSLSHAHKEELDQAVLKARTAIDEREAALQTAQEVHAKEKQQLQHELQEWIQEVDRQKKQSAAQQEQLAAERSARQLLEHQYRQETSVVRSMILEHSREEPQRGPQPADLEAKISFLMQRNELLEEACYRSANVITRLREALHREQMTSRALRQRDA